MKKFLLVTICLVITLVFTYNLFSQVFTESFEGETFPPEGWVHETIIGTTQWIRATGGQSNNPAGAAQGDFNARFYGGNNRGHSAHLITPRIDVSAIGTPQLIFHHAQRVWGGDQDTLRVYYSSSLEGEWQILASYTQDVPNWTERVFELPETLTTLYVKFVARANYGWGVVLDNIIVQEAPAVLPPSHLTVTNIVGDRADLGWRENGDASRWDIELGVHGFEPTGNPTVANVAQNPYRYTGLQPSTAYQFYIRANAGDDGVSDWAGPGSFNTSQIAAQLPFTEGFEAEIGWTIVNGTQTNKWHIGEATAYEGDRSAYISNDGGTTNAYTLNSASVVHVYRDIEFPEDAESNFELTFWWKGQGEGAITRWDYMRVGIIGTDVTPVAGTLLTAGYFTDFYNLNAEWRREIVDLPRETYAGQTKRLVFTWRNDSSAGTQPPVAIDNISIREIPAAAPACAVIVSPRDEEENVTLTARLSWQPGDNITDTYDVYFGTELPEEPNSANQEETSYNPGLLRYGTTYYWKIVPRNQWGTATNCPTWSFTTMNDPTVTEYPWAEGFEGETFPPVGWTQTVVSGTTQWIRATGGHSNNPAAAAEGDFNARFYSTVRGSTTYLSPPPFDVTELNVPQLTFFHAQTVWAGDQDTLKVYYRGSLEEEWEILSVYGENVPQWTERSFFLPQTLETLYLKFEAISDFGYGVVLDNISLREAPAVPAPSNLTATNISGDRADLGWRENGEATRWDIELGLHGFEPTGEPTVANVDNNPYRYTGLQPSTGYQFYVRANAGEDGVSDWAGPQGFVTSQIPATLPFSEGFEEEISWAFVNGTQPNQWHIGEATAYEGDRAAYISNDGGESNLYTINVASVVHIYRDIYFPPDSPRGFELSFRWKGQGEGAVTRWDYMRVGIIGTDVTPVAGTLLTTGYFANFYNLNGEWSQEAIPLHAENYAGQTKRIVFTWRNDTSVGTQPPAAIDNISIVELYQSPHPDIAVNPVPQHQAVNVPVDLGRLGWSYIIDEEFANPFGFRVYFGTDPEELSLHGTFIQYEEGEENYSLSRVHAPHLLYETTYYWKVVPTTIDGSDNGGRSIGRNRRVAPIRETYAAGLRGDAENVPVWSLTTQTEGTFSDYLTPPADPNGQYSGNIGGAEIIFTPDEDEDEMTSIIALSSTNPAVGSVYLFPNPDALGRYFSFIVENGAVFRNGRYLQLQFNIRPNQLWYRPGTGGWTQIPDEAIDWDEPLSPIIDLQVLFDEGRRNDEFEFAGDSGGTNTLPVELSSFTAAVIANISVQLQWVSETETNMLGYRVYRSNDNRLSAAQTLTFTIIPATNTSESQQYSFLDEDVLPGNSYYYWLQSVDLDLTNSFYGPISVSLAEEEEEIPQVYVTALYQNYPNPFNPNTTIKFSLKEETNVELIIYNILGQNVKTLYKSVMNEGNYEANWDGTDNNGKDVTSGIYFYRLTTDHYNQIYKMLLVK